MIKESSSISEDVTKENSTPGTSEQSQGMISENIKTLSSSAKYEDVTKQNIISGNFVTSQEAIIQFTTAHSEATSDNMTKKNIVITVIGTPSQNVIYQDITTSSTGTPSEDMITLYITTKAVAQEVIVL